MSSPLVRLLRENPIVVTGMGAFCSAGDSVQALWNSAVAGKSLAAWRNFRNGATTSSFAVCSAPELDMSAPNMRRVRKLDRCVQMASVAATQAWDDAQLSDAYPSDRVGVIIGSSRGPLGKRIESLRQNGSKLPPSLAADSTFGSLSGSLAQSFKLKGPGASISATCASAAFAVAVAAEQILLGRVDAMLVGGTEAPLETALLEQLDATGVIASHEQAEQACRPFDIDRNGIVVGEGSGFLILESAVGAAARGARAHARLAGWAIAVDNSGRTGVTSDGSTLSQTMLQALRIAELDPADVSYINAHGTGTKMNDAAEAQAILGLFAGRSDLACSSTKPVTGHCLGATPALEAIVSIAALAHQIIPPTANCSSQDPLCPINVQPLTAKPAKLSVVMSNSLGFWGYHAALIFTT